MEGCRAIRFKMSVSILELVHINLHIEQVECRSHDGDVPETIPRFSRRANKRITSWTHVSLKKCMTSWTHILLTNVWPPEHTCRQQMYHLLNTRVVKKCSTSWTHVSSTNVSPPEHTCRQQMYHLLNTRVVNKYSTSWTHVSLTNVSPPEHTRS